MSMSAVVSSTKPRAITTAPLRTTVRQSRSIRGVRRPTSTVESVRSQGGLSPERAIADYSREIDINPNDSEAHLRRGIAYRMQGDSDRAIGDFAKAIDINPHDASSGYAYRGSAFNAKVTGNAPSQISRRQSRSTHATPMFTIVGALPIAL